MATKDTKKAKLAVREFDGKSASDMAVPKWMAGEATESLVSQAVLVARKNAHIRRAHTKERAEVRGGGAKPWRQKGTGRARHGSRRSPIWVGGGTTFGPRSRKQRVVGLTKGMRLRALLGVLSKHAEAGRITVIKFGDKIPEKTKDVAEQTAGVRGLLLIVAEENDALIRVGRNVPGLKVIRVSEVATTDLVSASSLWIDEKAMSALKSRVEAKV